ncbi:MAG TPA: DNA-3-methyladenine glycosylase [Candidatus Limnocylindrales bacterium]|nr:DNA-3-methyladenine glycosylase [Candidatus Limnocylindrales bacterium]
MRTAEPFDRSLLAGDPVGAARALVGAILIREPDRAGRIVEVEAYVGTSDEASHARFGPTDRNRVMWGGPGVAYVYLVYGMYDCLNVVVEPANRPAAVLVRAVEPLAGIDAMRTARLAHARARRRAWGDERLRAEAARLDGLDPPRVASGPGAVAAAFSIDRADTGTDLCVAGTRLRLATGDSPSQVAESPRIGIAYAGEPWLSKPWRFFDPASPAVSGRTTTSRRRVPRA